MQAAINLRLGSNSRTICDAPDCTNLHVDGMCFSPADMGNLANRISTFSINRAIDREDRLAQHLIELSRLAGDKKTSGLTVVRKMRRIINNYHDVQPGVDIRTLCLKIISAQMPHSNQRRHHEVLPTNTAQQTLEAISNRQFHPWAMRNLDALCEKAKEVFGLSEDAIDQAIALGS